MAHYGPSLVKLEYLTSVTNLSKADRVMAEKAVERLDSVFASLLEENKALRRAKGEGKFVEYGATEEEEEEKMDERQGTCQYRSVSFDDNQPASCVLRKPPKIYEKELLLMKVNFLLLKCKQLYDLFQLYDSHTDILLMKKKKLEREVSQTIGPFQGRARRLLQRNILGDISSAIFNLSEQVSNNETVEYPIHYLAEQIIESRSKRQKALSPRKKKVTRKHSKHDKKNMSFLHLKQFMRCKHPESNETQNDVEKIPQKLLLGTHRIHSRESADRIMSNIQESEMPKKHESYLDVLRNLGAEEEMLKYMDEFNNREPENVEGKGEISEQWCSSRMPYFTFPKFSKNMKKYFIKRNNSLNEIQKPVKKYSFDNNFYRIFSSSSLAYAKKKRKNLAPTAKSLVSRECDIPEEEEQVKVDDATCDKDAGNFDEVEEEIDEECSEEAEETCRDIDKEVKKYMERLSRVRADRLALSSWQGEAGGSWDRLRPRITVSCPSSQVLRDRVLCSKIRDSRSKISVIKGPKPKK